MGISKEEEYCLENCVEKLQIAIKKQEPIGEPEKEWMDIRGYSNTFVCGECHKHIRMPFMMKHCEYDYCPYCGQKWTD